MSHTWSLSKNVRLSLATKASTSNLMSLASCEVSNPAHKRLSLRMEVDSRVLNVQDRQDEVTTCVKCLISAQRSRFSHPANEDGGCGVELEGIGLADGQSEERGRTKG